jgi:predicted oxidoreductase
VHRLPHHPVPAGTFEVGAIVYSPMASGLLTGAFTAERAARLEPGDWRADHPDFAEPALSRNLALAAALRPVAERHGVTPAAVAIAWTLSFPGVTEAIVGASGGMIRCMEIRASDSRPTARIPAAHGASSPPYR